jgi:formylglycine-generating enzyme required for sulfatase activity
MRPDNIVATSPNTLPNNLSLYRYKRSNKSYTEGLGDGVSLTLMLTPAGEFVMGAPPEEPDSQDNERPQQQVRLSQFLLGRYPVTQAQWRVAAGYDRSNRDLNPEPSRFKGDNLPVEQVSWEDAQEFCQRLSVKTGKDYRLPSEAQWEYACRAGTETPFHFGEIITTEIANYNGNSTYNGSPKGERSEKTIEVGSFPANDWGLHDMHGNVWEWCEDDYHSSYDRAPNDGSAWVDSDRTKTSKLLRGGSWYFDPANCRSAVRVHHSRGIAIHDVGFRVCCVPPRVLLGS